MDAQDKRTGGGELITPKRRTHNMIKKFTDRARQGQDVTAEERTQEKKRKRQEMERAMNARRNMCSTLARVARGPFKTHALCQDLANVQEVRGMNDGQFGHLMQAAYAVLDKVNKNIFLGNLTEVVERDDKKVLIAIKTKGSIMSAPTARRTMDKHVERMVKRGSRRRREVYVDLAMMPRATRPT